MRALVVYQSRTGNTKKIAEAIAEVVGWEAVPVLEVSKIGCDLLFLGGGVYCATIDKVMKRFLRGLNGLSCKKVALFGTSAGGKKPFHAMKKYLKKAGLPVDKSFFYVPGEFAWMNKGRPNEEDIERAKQWAKSILEG